ncbi:hypothetical protein OIDMADRAFT_41299 [Oidiodendron maius Zn]|uniref:Impact N-terminal domain-containing protein n=1 Tax=Oidiodendron maius (strain Zn) TaxID=913774 RepID=A0A0C3H1V5_OIDMZ|nr:hypothetical protein OIDMADRAFT_41299 [Oidiodendron maius Zn]
MASQADVHDLLRILTTGRNKLSMMAAMGRVKVLQEAGLRSIAAISTADLSAISTAINDAKAAKSLQTACKSLVKDPSKKRSADSTVSPTAKRIKSAYELASEPQTPQALEASLELPQPSTDEEVISQTTIYTNRAPLVLAFAVQLLKYTMPEQPLSSRLSLAQAVVSVNSRSKAVSLGLKKGASAEGEGWGIGQPKVRILGREIHVLKRGGYNWRPEDERVESQEGAKIDWAVSASVTSKKSTFVARSIAVSSPSQARAAIQKLLSISKEIREADHNITAWRVRSDSGSIIEESNDDGETGGGRHILQILQSNDVVDMLLVVTRWYGGIMLGPDRWRIMSQVSRDALSQRLRVAGVIDQEALWGLDLETMRSTDAPVTGGTGGGMPIYKPESARSYILKAFGCPPPAVDSPARKKKSGAALEREKEENLGLLLGALDMLFSSWVEHISRDELDHRAWAWYVQVRPEVESGVAGWGGKGDVPLSSILNLRRRD